MSESEARKWEARYRAGEHTGETAPSALLARWLARLPRGRALDVACGAGCNALALAQAGFAVQAVDIAEAGLALGRARAAAAGLAIEWIRADLDEWVLPADAYDVIVNCQFLKRDLIAQYADALRPGGMLIFEQHLRTSRPVAGPAGPRHRLRPGELPGLLADLRILHYEEGLHPAADKLVALVRCVAARAPFAF